MWIHDGSYFDWITAFEWSDAVLDFDGSLALRFDAAKPMGPTTDYSTTFVIEGPTSVVTVSCNGNDRGVETCVDDDPRAMAFETHCCHDVSGIRTL